MPMPITVTVLTGSPGTDGTHSFDQILRSSNDARVTAIVSKRGRKRKKSLRNAVSIVLTTEQLLQLGQGCSCCMVRGDLMTKVRRIAETDSADHVVIQSEPQADLSVLAKTFTVADRSGAVLSDVARLQNMVTVINAGSFLSTIKSESARLLVERVELANVILLEHSSKLGVEDEKQLLDVLAALNGDARVVRDDQPGFNLASVQSERSFDPNASQNRASSPVPGPVPTTPSGVVRLNYRAQRPFHPTRFYDLIHQNWGNVLKASGAFWVASREDLAAELNVVGGSRMTTMSGMWWATVPENRRPKTLQFRAYMKQIWHPDFGDRHQNLSVLALGVKEETLRLQLDQCLLTDEELAVPEKWKTMKDRFQWPEVM